MYQFGEKKEYLTPSEAEKIEGCVRTSKTPKSSKFGRQNLVSALWNSEEQLFAWRKSWEVIINEEQERHGIPERVDCRSNAARGLTEQPTVHEGYHARKLEAMGIKSERCELNRQIKADNKLLRELKHQVQKLIKAVKENIPSIAVALESLRDHMVLLQYQLLFNASQQDSISSRKDIISSILKEYREVQICIKEKTAERKELMAQKKNCGIHFIRAGKLEEQITTLTEDIEELKSQKAQLLSRIGCQASEVKGFDSKLKELDTMQERLETQHTALSAQKEQDKEKYLEIKSAIAPENMEAVHAERAAIRPEGRKNLLKRLQEIYQQRYEYDTFRDADEMIDKELQEEPIYEKPKSISERLKREPTHDQPTKKPKKKEYER